MYLKTRHRRNIWSFLVGKYNFVFVRKIPNTRFYQNTSTVPNTSQNRPDIRRFWRNTIPKMVYQVVYHGNTNTILGISLVSTPLILGTLPTKNGFFGTCLLFRQSGILCAGSHKLTM